MNKSRFISSCVVPAKFTVEWREVDSNKNRKEDLKREKGEGDGANNGCNGCERSGCMTASAFFTSATQPAGYPNIRQATKSKRQVFHESTNPTSRFLCTASGVKPLPT